MPSPARFARCAAFCLLAVAAQAADSWIPLFNGKDLNGWTTWLGKPHPSTTMEGLAKNEKGEYTAPLGANKDPLQVFSVVQVDGGPALRMSGQMFGYLQSTKTYHDYHLRLQFKWGDKKWAPRENAVRDSGLLYHVSGDGGFSSSVWPRCGELQIQEHDCGDLYAIGIQLTALARPTEDKKWIYDPKGQPIVFLQQKPIGNRCIHLSDREKPTGEWNSIELFCLGDTVTYVVNGGVVLRLTHCRSDADTNTPLTEGKVALQSEGAEIFYRNVEIRSITALPAEYAEK